VLVTRPRTRDIDDALAFRRDLARMGIGVAAVVLNRVTPPRPPRSADDRRLAALPEPLHDTVRRMESDIDALREIEAAALNSLEASLPRESGPGLYVVPAREIDISSLEDIAEIADELAR
jgi:hypothetical protein